MKRLLYVSDIHSHNTILQKTLVDKNFSPDDALVVGGDAFDRGKEFSETANFLLSLHEQKRLIYIRGNHEDLLYLLIQQLSSGMDPISVAMRHYSNGTWQTALDIAHMEESEAIRFPLELVSRVRNSRVYKELLSSCVDYLEIGNKYILTHAYIPCIEKGFTYQYNQNWKEASPLEWNRARWYNGVKLALEDKIRVPDRCVVVGHMHVSQYHKKYENRGSEWGLDSDFTPFYCEESGIIATDACTAYSKKMNILEFFDEEL